MSSREFKKEFGEKAISHGFESAFGGWMKESSDCIVVIDLQKSKYGDYFELNIKVFIQGMFRKIYVKNKDLVKKDTGDVFVRPPKEYNEVLDFDTSMDTEKRMQRLEDLFREYLVPFSEKALTKEGLKQLAYHEKIYLLPAIKQELEA